MTLVASRFGCAAVVVLVLIARAGPAAAQAGAASAVPAAPGHESRVRTDLFIEIPLDRYSTDVVFPFGGSHQRVPGVVAVNRQPYYCAPHERAFRDRAAFVAHLRTRHGIDDADVPRALLVQGGQVRYVGD